MRLTIDRFQGDRAVLRTDAGQEFVVPRGELAPHVREGDTVTVRFVAPEDAASDRATRTKDILNELLGNE